MKLFHITCHQEGIITYIQHLGNTARLKFGKAKIVQNSARVMTTFEFDRDYLKNRSIYGKKLLTIFLDMSTRTIARRGCPERLNRRAPQNCQIKGSEKM